MEAGTLLNTQKIYREPLRRTLKIWTGALMTQQNVDCTNRRIPGYQRYLRVRISIPRSAAQEIITSTGCTHFHGPLPGFAHPVHLKPTPRTTFC